MSARHRVVAFAGLTSCLHGQVAGTLDAGFTPNVTAAAVYAAVVQADGRIVLGGVFTSVDGQARNSIARLNADGSVESLATFNPGTGANGRVNALAIQPDGRVLMAGEFTTVNGQPRNRIARLHADGTLESTATFNPGGGANGIVRGVALQPDGKILIAGEFTTIGGQLRSKIARLLPDGTVESLAAFNPGIGADDAIHSVSVRPDGKLLVWGRFDQWGGEIHNRIVRLNANGTLESAATFNPGVAASNWVWSAAVQPDGKILVGGEFTTMDGQPRNRIARLHANGSVESLTTFNPGTGADSTIRCIIVQTDGNILIGGLFTNVAGQPRNRIARLKSNGTLESTASFDAGTGANETVSSVAVQPDGRIVIAGAFTAINGQQRSFAARLLNGPATEVLSAPDNTRVRWQRGGTSPEIEQATCELSTDGGLVWSPLGTASRISGGWERSGLSLPPAGHLRARASTGAGLTNSSSGRIESIAAFSFLTSLQTWRRTHFGTIENTGSASNNADPDNDGLENLAEFAFALNPAAPDASSLPPWRRDDDDFVLTFTRPAGTDGIDYAAEYSLTLAPGDWTEIPNIAAEPDFQFYAPAVGQRIFVRLRVTAP